jgi:hypothetical protein
MARAFVAPGMVSSCSLVLSLSILAALALLLPLGGCSVSDNFDDAGTADDAGGGSGGAGGGDENGAIGTHCESDDDCSASDFCDEEIALVSAVPGLPNGIDDLPSAIFPGGSCTPIPAAPYDPTGVDSCDPLLAPGQQGCGSEGLCMTLPLEGDPPLVACRATCEPSATDSGCDTSGYTCNFVAGACLEGCQSDEECRLILADTDGDGVGDTEVYDDESEARCDVRTFRCTHAGGEQRETGAPCERVDDCESDGECISALRSFSGLRFPGGYCSKLGCDVDGRECQGDDAVCTAVRGPSGVSASVACMQGCEIGAEDAALVLGPDGHGAGCRAGYSCHYNGSDNGSLGICAGGVYNDVTEPNIGAACQTHDECYSPYGYGYCLWLQVGDVVPPTGTCSLIDCAAPGLPEDLCGPGAQCIGLGGDTTFCVQLCDDASECAAGQACADDDVLPETPPICYPTCTADSECRNDTERCQIPTGASFGTCVASGG